MTSDCVKWNLTGNTGRTPPLWKDPLCQLRSEGQQSPELSLQVEPVNRPLAAQSPQAQLSFLLPSPPLHSTPPHSLLLSQGSTQPKALCISCCRWALAGRRSSPVFAERLALTSPEVHDYISTFQLYKKLNLICFHCFMTGKKTDSCINMCVSPLHF